MTLLLETLSGTIETGFYAGYMAEVLIGNYIVPTADLCKLLGDLAGNPSARNAVLTVGNREGGTERIIDYLVSLEDQLLAACASGAEDLSAMETQLAAKQGKMSDNGWMEFAGGSTPIEVIVDDAAWVVCVGEHKIPTTEFREFACYS